jgi:hypothetical protein
MGSAREYAGPRWRLAGPPRAAVGAMTRAGMTGGLLAAALLASLPTPADAPPPTPSRLTILVDPGPFSSVEEAAGAEDRVAWGDADPADDEACTETFAALELRRFLARCLAPAEVAVSSSRRLPDSGDVILLATRGTSQLADSLAPWPSREPLRGADAFRIRTLDRGHGSVWVIQGVGRSGALYGAYALLEAVGMRFYGLGDTGTVFPTLPARLPRDLRLDGEPAFSSRGLWAWEPRGNEEFFLWMARNRINLWTAAEGRPAFLKKLGVELTCGGHGMQQQLLDPRADYPYDHPGWKGDEDRPRDPHPAGPGPPRDADGNGKLSCFEAHPEWYGLHDGARSPGIRGESGDNFCTSNREAVRELADHLVRSLRDGAWRYADVVNLWMLDGGRWCECDSCRALGGPSARLLELARRVSARVAAARRDGRLRRDVRIAVPAYLETLSPPGSPAGPAPAADGIGVTFFPYFRCYAHALGDPRCAELNRRLMGPLRAWSELGRAGGIRLGIGEYYNVSAFKSLPLVFPHVMAEDLRLYARAGARDFHYMHAPTRLWGTWTLNHALLARLLWSPDADVDSLLDDFCRRYYPTTSARMRRCLAYLETASANVVALQHCVGVYGTSGTAGGRLADHRLPVFPLRHLQLDSPAGGAPLAPSLAGMAEAMRGARRELDAARAACRDSLERDRLADDERRFAYGEAMFAFYDHLVRVALQERRGDAAGARREFAGVERAARRLRAVRDLVRVASSHANARDGLEASGVVATYDFFRRRYGSPTPPSPGPTGRAP